MSGAAVFIFCLKGSPAANRMLEAACADLSKFASTLIREQAGLLATASGLALTGESCP
jgi:N-acetylglucosamine kinase-like BadF-type ATPase